MNPAAGPTLLFLVTEDWYFYSHRLELGRAAAREGYRVIVVTRTQRYVEALRRERFEVIPLDIARGSINPLRDIKTILALRRLYRDLHPDIVHHVALKPVLYGSIAARLAGVPSSVNALAGLGFVFASNQLRARLLRPLVKAAFRFFLNGRATRVIVQNPEDRQLLLDSGVASQAIATIRGSGVDLDRFHWQPEPAGPPLVLLASRMLWDKGLREFVEAARMLRSLGVQARFVLVGDTDDENPAAVPVAQLKEWQREGAVEWWGRRDDMQRLFPSAHVVCLPSYREGLPKVLLEAAASGRPIVAADVPGCREIVCHGNNGLLVPPRNAAALAQALRQLIDAPSLRARMGQASRKMAEAEFSVDRVITETLTVYRSLLNCASVGRAA